jgi:hypothetical protein
MIADPTHPPETAFMTARVHLQAMVSFHTARHDMLIKQKGMYEQAKFHRLMMEVAYLGQKRIDLLEAADTVIREGPKRRKGGAAHAGHD